jgi:predicted transposase/invertase (TIGR01784 family)
MQIKGTPFYGRRTLYYWAKIFGSQLDYMTEEEVAQKEKKGRAYTDLNKCIVISLMDFQFFKDDRYHRCFVLKDRLTNDTHTDLDYLDLYFVELEKFEKRHEQVKTVLDRWITFLNYAHLYSKENLPKELAEITPIRKASERLEVMYLDKKEREYYEAQQKRYLDETSRIQAEVAKGIEEGINKAVEEAVGKAVEEAVGKAVEQTELKSKIETAKKLIRLGLANEMIVQGTGLSISQIEALREELK